MVRYPKVAVIAGILLSGCAQPGVLTGRVDFYDPADYQGQHVIIRDSTGGRMSGYYDFYAWMLYSGSTIEIQGHCDSGCTLALQSKIVNQVCAHRDAVFQFHAARYCKLGSTCASRRILREDTEIFYNLLDPRVRALLPTPDRWTLDYITLQAADLSRIGVIQLCADP